MAPADSTSSPRDHAADANPELARKKQRLSEDPGASPTESIIIEVADSEDIGATMDNAIEIEDGLRGFDNYSDDFSTVAAHLSPVQYVRNVYDSIHGNFYMNIPDFVAFARAIHDHSNTRLDESREWHQHYLEDEVEFFNALVVLSLTVLNTGDLLNLRERFDATAVRQAVSDLLFGLEALCRRVLPSLPDTIKIALSRRDSAHTSTRQHTIEALNYITLAARIVCPDKVPTLVNIARYDAQLDPEELREKLGLEFCTAEIVSSLAAIIRTLGGAMRDVKDSWMFLQMTLSLFKIAVDGPYAEGHHPRADVESVMEIINACILPMICEKHPRALPEGFHEMMLDWGKHVLFRQVQRLDKAAAATAFQLFISSPSDALIPEAVDEDSLNDALQQVCDGNQGLLAELIAESWVMQTAKSFLRSDIMDIRYVGLAALQSKLVDIFKTGQASSEGFEHPQIQHAIRFMRKNDIIPYIFGPESRAGLLNRSSDVVAFLAATHTYTDTETDVIWRACSTNVEADFVKASFEVLTRVKDFLDFERLLHIARKYSTSPVNCFGVDALEFLPNLLQDIESKSYYLTTASERLAIGFVSIEILKTANHSHPCTSRDRLKQTVLTAISRLSGHGFSSDDRAQIYKYCVPEILNQTSHATSSVEVLSTLLPRSLHSLEAASIVDLIPIDAAVEELCSFVQARKQSQAPGSEIGAIICRLDCLGNLIHLSATTPEASIQERMFSCIYGEEAFSNEARDAAWQRLSGMAFSRGSSPILRSLFDGYVKDCVPPLASNLATPKLIDIILSWLRTVSTEGDEECASPLLSRPIWNALVRFAITSPDDIVATGALTAILDILFVSSVHDDTMAAATCQSEFARVHIDCLRALKDKYVAQPSQENLRYYMFAMNILRQAFSKSQEYLSANRLPLEPNALRLNETTDGPDLITFTAQIYSMSNEPEPIKVQASPSTTVSRLLARLPAFTSAGENRVIAGGVEITDVPDKTLLEAGVRQSGVILIRPRFSIDVDLDKLLTHPGPMEEAILSQHTTLEAFLDGPTHIAYAARLFLENIRLPAESRFRVVSSPATADELFPKDRQQRSLFSLFILRTHLSDLARLGLTDRGFALRAAHLLTAVILDKERKFDAYLMLEVLQTLCRVLQERPSSEERLDYFEKGGELAARLIELSFAAKSLPIRGMVLSAQPPLRNELASVIHRTIIHAYQQSSAVCTAFTEHEAAVELHGQLLLDSDMNFSAGVAHTLENVLDDEDVPRERVEFYWRMLYPSLTDALSNSYLSESYFLLINKVLNHLGSMNCDESWITNLVEELCSKVWSYKHMESPPLLIRDKAMLGVLRLFSKAVGMLKKKQKSSHLLTGLPAKLFGHFLFPPQTDRLARPLVQEETRTIVYDLIKLTCSKQTDYHELAALTSEVMKYSSRQPGATFPGMSEWIRPPRSASGLRNLGMTCYMNSLLQQLFGNLQFRKFILDQAIVNTEKQATLVEVQSLFASMQDSVDPWSDTLNLAKVLNVQVGVQDDVHTFYTTLLSRLEDSMPCRESRQTLNSFFTGKSVTQIRGDCGHVSSKEEPFTELSITVKNKASLHDSLDEFVQGEPLEGANKYMCMSCGSDNEGLLVNAMRRTCLDNLPNGLTFCLKRFAFENMLDGENKVNDRFEFPAEIDMSLYKRDHLEDPAGEYEPDLFELVGVIVHQGSLSYGHYWSYVRVPAAQTLYRYPWMCLEDTKYVPCTGGIQQVQENCFGGLQWSDGSERPESAYVLFYQRKNYVAEADRLSDVTKALQIDQQILPKVHLQDVVAAQVRGSNEWRMRIALLFQDQFWGYLQWLLNQYPEQVQLQQNAISSLEDSDERREGLEAVDGELDAHVGGLITNYALRIFLPDTQGEERLEQLMKSIATVIRLRPAVATHICRQFAEDDFGFATLIKHGGVTARTELFGFFFTCLNTMRQEGSQFYEITAKALIGLHSDLLNNVAEDNPAAWREYLKFASNFAAVGADETRLILDRGYLTWVFEILYMNFDPKLKQRHLRLWKSFKNSWIDRTALYEFLHDLLDGFVDLSEMPMEQDPRLQTAEGWPLELKEANALAFQNPNEERGTGLLIEVGVHFCSKKLNNWIDYGPGKLIGLLVGENTHHSMSERICESMRVQWEVEDKELEPLIFMTLHILLQLPKVDGGMQRCEILMDSLCTNIILWETKERRALSFFREAYKMVPGLVVRCFPTWADIFLLANHQPTRQLASDSLKEMIFDPAPMHEEGFEAMRLAGTRDFIFKCKKKLTAGYQRRESRARYECMIVAVKHASDYLLAMKEEMSRRQEQGGDVSDMVMVQWEETKSLVTEPVRWLESLSAWEPVTALPTRSLGVRRSVEADDSEELDTSDADGEDDFSEGSD